MPMPAYPTDEAAFAAALNSDPYDSESNPEGLGAGGHRQNFPAGMDAIVALANFVNLAGAFIQPLAEQVSEDAQSAAAGSGTEASVAEILAGLAAHYLSIRRVYAANVPVALTDGATINWDMAAAINVKVTLSAAGRTLANPTNKVPGKSGILRVIQDATGGRTITTYGSDYIWIGGEPAWPTTPGARSLIAYFVGDDGKVELTFAGSSA